MQKLSINLTRIPADRIKPGRNGQYIDLVLFENREGPDQYGNDGFVAVDVTQEERKQGVKGPIIGNWKHLGERSSSRPQGEHPGKPARPKPAPPARRPRADPDPDAPEDDIPF